MPDKAGASSGPQMVATLASMFKTANPTPIEELAQGACELPRTLLERVEVFKYLGHLIAFDDDDTLAVRGNLAKARGVWARISRVLRAENTSTRVCGMFYKATVQSVLLFGIETWLLSPAALQRLAGFHVKAARRMTGLLPKKVGGSWITADRTDRKSCPVSCYPHNS